MYLGQWTQGSAIPNRIPNHYRIVLTSTPPPLLPPLRAGQGLLFSFTNTFTLICFTKTVLVIIQGHFSDTVKVNTVMYNAALYIYHGNKTYTIFMD